MEQVYSVHKVCASSFIHPLVVTVFLQIDTTGCPQIVATQSKAIEQNKHRPRIVATVIKCGTQPHVRMISDDSHHTSASLFVLYEPLPQLTVGLRGGAYY